MGDQEVLPEMKDSLDLLHQSCQAGDTLKVESLLLSNPELVLKKCPLGMISLHYAVLSGNPSSVMYILSKEKGGINAKDNKGRTPLHLAAETGNVEIILILIEKGARVNFKDNAKNMPLSIAVKNQHKKAVKILLNLNAVFCDDKCFHLVTAWGDIEIVKAVSAYISDINQVNDKGRTALHVAADLGHCDVIDFLVESGARVNIGCSQGRTPLHYACNKGHYKAVAVLLERGADTSVKDYVLLTPLHLACIRGHCDVVKLLISSGVNVNVLNISGLSPLFYAIINGHTNTIRVLLEAQAVLESSAHLTMALTVASRSTIHLLFNQNAFPALTDIPYLLHMSAARGLTDLVRKLLSTDGINVDAENAEGKTPLFLAAENGHLDTLKALIIGGAQINVLCTDSKISALYCSVEKGQTAVMEYLLLAGADQKIKSKSGLTPLHVAAMKGNLEAVKLLAVNHHIVNLKGPSGNAAVHIAVDNNHYHLLEILKKSSADFNAVNDDGNGVLHIAAKNGSLDIVKGLINVYKIDPDFLNTQNYSSLHIASEEGHVDVVEFLSQVGAIDIVSPQTKRTALHVASEAGHLTCVKLLVTNKANIELQTSKGETAMHLALLHNTPTKAFEIIQTIISNNFICQDMNAEGGKSIKHKYLSLKNIEGQTVLLIAALKGYLDIIKHLVQVNKDILQDVDSNYQNALHLAAGAGHKDVVEYLIQLMDVNLCANVFHTALYLSIRQVQLDCAQLLLKSKAVLSLKDTSEPTVLFTACRIKDIDMAFSSLKSLIDGFLDVSKEEHNLVNVINTSNYSGQTVLHVAVENNNLACIRLLVQYGIHCNVKDSCGNTALHIAAQTGCPEVLSFLINNCADLLTETNNNQLTPLHLAVKGQHIECIKLLVERNPVVHMQTNQGETVLHTAFGVKNDKVVQTLIQYASSLSPQNLSLAINTQNTKGETPLHIAADFGKLEILKLLKPFIEDVAIQDVQNGDTPMHRAVRKSNLHVVKFLVKTQRKCLRVPNKSEGTPSALAYKLIYPNGFLHISTQDNGVHAFLQCC